MDFTHVEFSRLANGLIRGYCRRSGLVGLWEDVTGDAVGGDLARDDLPEPLRAAVYRNHRHEGLPFDPAEI